MMFLSVCFLGPSFYILLPIGRLPPANQLTNLDIAWLESYMELGGTEEGLIELMVHFYLQHQQRMDLIILRELHFNGPWL